MPWHRIPSHRWGSCSPKHETSLPLGQEESRTALYYLSCSLEHYSLTEGDSWPICQDYNLSFLKKLLFYSKKNLGLIFHLKDKTSIRDKLNLISAELRSAMNFQGLHYNCWNSTVHDTVSEYQHCEWTNIRSSKYLPPIEAPANIRLILNSKSEDF